MSHSKSVANLDELRRFDSCTVANAIERFNVRPRNEGFVVGAATCRFPGMAPAVGYAVPARIKTYMPPITGRCYYDHAAWWEYMMTLPAPRFVVLQDVDSRLGFGALFGEIHARICRALDCIAVLTNGAVRDLDDIESMGFQAFSGSVSVSHSYAHVVDFGSPVEIGGLTIHPGDLLHGDRHGVISVPREVVAELPHMAKRLREEERDLIEFTEQPGMSVEALAKKIEKFSEKHLCK